MTPVVWLYATSAHSRELDAVVCAGAAGEDSQSSALGAENVDPEQEERPAKRRRGRSKKAAEATEAGKLLLLLHGNKQEHFLQDTKDRSMR